MAWHCRRWNALPEAGGLLDQPAGLLLRMAMALNAYDALDAFNRFPPGQGAAWVQANPDAWRIVCRVKGWSKD